jgi:pimeloyl-ACP methyl ester carboxylesterase
MCAAAYVRIQTALSPFVQVITYDRTGLGHSEDIADSKDAEHVCDHLHRLLESAGIKSPIVIAGHSIGGLFLRVYAGKFPDEVAGAVFLDATHPRISQALGGNDWIAQTCEFYRTQKRAVEAGHLHESDTLLLESFADLPELQAQLEFAALQPRRYDVSIETLQAFEVSAAQAESYGDLGNRPVISITAPAAVKFDWLPDFDIDAYAAAKVSLHRELAELSTRGRHVQIEGAEHGTLITDPRFAAAAASEIIAVVREAASAE